MASAKDTFGADTFAANSFASGTFRGLGVTVAILMFRTLAADSYVDGAVTSQVLVDGAIFGDSLVDGAIAAQSEPN